MQRNPTRLGRFTGAALLGAPTGLALALMTGVTWWPCALASTVVWALLIKRD
jgi:hypothetical protein